MRMKNDSESEKLGVIIFGQQFCSKLEHIPIKKRILLRDSALCQRTPSSVEEVDQKIGSPPVAQNSNLSGSPFVALHSDPNFFLKQQADNLKSVQLNDKSRETVVLNNEEADSHPLIQTPVDFTVDNIDKGPRTGSLSPSIKSELPSVSSLAPAAKGDSLGSESSEAVPSLTGNVTDDSYSDDKSTFQPDHVSCKDLEVLQSITQNNRILWDLNVEMDAWEKPNDHLNVESKFEPTASDVQSVTNLERSEDFRLKGETVVPESNIQLTVESMNSGGICKYDHTSSDSADVEPCKAVRKDQQVAAGSFPDKACSVAESLVEIASINIFCNHDLAPKTDGHVTSILGENTSENFASAPRRHPGSLFVTPNNSVISTEEQNCDNKNIIVEGEGSVNILQVSDDEDYGSSKKGTNFKAGQSDVTDMSSSAYRLEQRASVEEGDLFVTPKEKVIAETFKAAPSMHPSEELTEHSPKHVDIDKGNPSVGRFQEGCDASIVQSLCMPAKCNQGAIVIEQVPSMDKDRWAQIEQDYEDGELRDLDMHCWNEDETKIGDTEYLDYEPDIKNIDDLDELQSSVSAIGKGESGLKSKKYKLSETLIKDHLVRMDGANMGLNGIGYGTRIVNTQLEKKLSGWDQLPKDGYPSSEKLQETHGILSRTPRSELQSCSDIPTVSEDAEDKETVVERPIRHNDMDESYPAESGSGFDKFSGKRRSTPHIHGRNRAEDWDSERRSSVNYHDLYDNHSGSRRININSKGREHRRSRSPYDRNEAYGSHNSYSRYYRGRYGNHAEGSGRSLREARNGYWGSLADDRSDSEFHVRQQFLRRDRSLSPRATAHLSETFDRSRSRSRTRSPPLWVPPYERLGPRVHRRSPEFSANDRVKRPRLPFWKSNFPADSEMRYTSPPRSGFLPQNKCRWNDEEEFALRGSRDRSPVRSFRQREKFDASCSRGRFKSSEDFRPVGYRGKMREITFPDGIRGYNGGKDRRQCENSFEAGQRKRYYKDGFTRRNDADDDVATQNFHLKEDFLEDGETRNVNMRKKESRNQERYENDQLSYRGCTPNGKR